MFTVQIVDGEKLQAKAIDQWTRELPVIAKRGDIVDCNGKVLATSQGKYSVYARLRSVVDKQSTATILSQILNIDNQTLQNKLNSKVSEVTIKVNCEKEEILIKYEPNVLIEDFERKLKESQEKDIKLKMTTVGPHRDDICIDVNGIDIRKFGSQGQQRTAALSLKLSEIELVKKITKDTPVLLLDDVLSELDSNRHKYLLDSIGNIQTIITCTGLDDFVNDRFEINKVFKVSNGKIVGGNDE